MAARGKPKAPPPSAAEVLAALKKAGKQNTAKIYRRHGATGEVWGVPYADMGKLEKRCGTAHALALELWESGVHEARCLACKLADPDALKIRELEGWLKAGGNYILMGHLGGLASRRKDAEKLARKWVDGKGELRRGAGWVVVCELANAETLEEAWARELLGRIQAEIHGAFDRERYHMNNALISIGGRYRGLRKAAAAAAKKIGKVEVDHGDTSCKTPDALPYMEKMWARADQGGRARGRR